MRDNWIEIFMVVCSKLSMAARIPISWLFLIVLLGVVAFFGYHIFQASYSVKPEISHDDDFIQAKKSVSFHPTVLAADSEEVPEPR